MRRILLLLLLLSLASRGWGEAGSKNAPEYPLEGVWGGHFPGSSLQNPREGIEVHFDRQSRNGFIHRVPRAKPPKRLLCSANAAVDRSTVVVHQTGKHVTITFPGAKGDESTFSGTFVNTDRIQGSFTNSCRGENYKMDLVSADSAGRSPVPRPPSVPPTQTPATKQHLTLKIVATDEDGKTYTFLYGLGYYYNPGTWTTKDTIPAGAGFTDLHTGPTAVLQLLFFPDWIVFDLYGQPSQLTEMASLEVRLTDFAKVAPNAPQTITPDDSSFVGAWPYDTPATSITMSYVATDDFLDREGWGTDAVSPEMLRISAGGEQYSVPYNAGSLLLGFDGVGLNP
jgi:hypothetical protein